jgi:hypothetical protein
MSAMDHAAAHERIEDLLLDPRRLAALDGSTAPEDVALREHVAGCVTCRSELDAWRQLEGAVRDALPVSNATADVVAAVEPIDLPPSLRTRVIEGARSEPRTPRAITAPVPIVDRRGPRWIRPVLAMAAALILVVGSGLVVVDQMSKRAAAEAETAALSSALAAVDRVLGAPGHVVVPLHQPDGTTAGSISWSRHDWVVITDAIERPPAGQTYTCWLVEEDGAQLVGSMQFAGETAFWAASVDKWATWEITPTTRFVVTLQQDGINRMSGPTVLEAALGA